MRMYSSETDVIAEGVQYLKFAVLAYLLHGLSLGSTNVLRSVQKVRLPMCVSLVSFVLNIFGNYVLIFGKFGLPRMGIAGASLSTLIVRIVECLFNFGYLVVLEKISDTGSKICLCVPAIWCRNISGSVFRC
jgi:Na+-driven multidrug efflux pump